MLRMQREAAVAAAAVVVDWKACCQTEQVLGVAVGFVSCCTHCVVPTVTVHVDMCVTL